MNSFSDYAGISLVVFSTRISLGLGGCGFGIGAFQINPRDILERIIIILHNNKRTL